MALGQTAITPREFRAVAGGDWRLGVTLWNNGSVVNLTGSTVAVSIVDSNGFVVVASANQSSGTTGADWANGLLVVAIPAATTQSFYRDCEYFAHISVTDSSGANTIFPLLPLIVTGNTPG